MQVSECVESHKINFDITVFNYFKKYSDVIHYSSLLISVQVFLNLPSAVGEFFGVIYAL